MVFKVRCSRISTALLKSSGSQTTGGNEDPPEYAHIHVWPAAQPSTSMRPRLRSRKRPCASPHTRPPTILFCDLLCGEGVCVSPRHQIYARHGNEVRHNGRCAHRHCNVQRLVAVAIPLVHSCPVLHKNACGVRARQSLAGARDVQRGLPLRAHTARVGTQVQQPRHERRVTVPGSKRPNTTARKACNILVCAYEF